MNQQPDKQPKRSPNPVSSDLIWIIATINVILRWVGLIFVAVGAWQTSNGRPDLWWLIPLGFAVIALDVAIDYWIANPLVSQTDEPDLNRRGTQYIGRVVPLIEPITAGRGKISLEDTHWTVEGPDMPSGENVEIVETRGSILVVRKASAPQQVNKASTSLN